MVWSMNFRTPLIASIAVLSALGGVAAAAIALPTSPPPVKAAAIVPSATPTPEVRTETVHRTIHVVQRHKTPARPAATAAPSRDDSGHHSVAVASTRVSNRVDDSGHHSGRDDSGHHDGGDDSGHHGGRGRGRGGDDD
jgi:hypothetical protein